MEPFGLIDFDKLSFVSDRGPNLVAALKKYNTLYCYPHRLNNVLKCSFFQSQSKEKQAKVSSTPVEEKNIIDNIISTDTIDRRINSEHSNYSSLSTDDENEKNEPTLPIKDKDKYKNQTKLASENTADPKKLKFNDLHPSAQEIIKTITRCKQLVQFVKKVK